MVKIILATVKVSGDKWNPTGHMTRQKRHYYVKTTSFWRNNEVIIAARIRWDTKESTTHGTLHLQKILCHTY